MKFAKAFAALLAATALFAGCEQTQPVSDTISVTPDALVFAETTASVQSVSLTSGNVWVAKADAEWITVEPASGSAVENAEVKIYVTKNEDADRKGVVTFICNNSLLKTAAVSISQKGDKGDGVTEISCAEFIKLPDSNSDMYRLRGTVTGSINATYGNFYITDDGGTSQVQVYGATNWDVWKDKVSKGGTITVKGNKKTYQKDENSTPVIEMINGVIEAFEEGTIERPDNVTDVTVKEFIAKPASTTEWYRMKGTVGEVKNTTYGNFYIQDATGSVLVYGVDNWDKYKADFAAGDNVTVVGKRKDYVNNGTTTVEVDEGYIEEFSKAVIQTIDTESVAEVLAATAGSTATLNNALVVATNGKGYLVTDGTDYVYVYEGDKAEKASAAIGDKVKVEGKMANKSGMMQFTEPKTTVLSSDNEVAMPAAKDITSGFDSYSSTKVEYIVVDATLKIDGNYTNFLVDGATNLKGSISYPLAASGYKDFDGARCIIKGFYLYTSSVYVTICLTEVSASDTPFFSVSTTAINAGCNDEKASFKINSNVDWTVSCDNADFTLSAESGSGSATINVTFAKNSADAPKVANITVSTSADVTTKSYTVVLTQAKFVDFGSAKFVKVTTAPEDWSGSYLFVCEETKCAVDGSLASSISGEGIGVKGKRVDVTITDGVIAVTDDLLKSVLKIAAMDGGKYSIQTGAGDYLKEAAKDGSTIKAGLLSGTEPTATSISFTDAGKMQILSESGDTAFLCNRGSKTETNPANMFFRFYNKSNLKNEQYYHLAAYKYVEE